MLALAVRNTKKLVRHYVAAESIRLGRYFTEKEIAATMAASLCIPEKEEVTLLDPGAGTGILSAAAIEEICISGGVSRIRLDAYETDERFLPMLKDNLERIRKKCKHDYNVRLFVTVYEKDFWEDAAPIGEEYDGKRYDLVLLSPPEGVVPEGSFAEAFCKRVSPRGSDLAFLFTEAAAARLAEGGQMAALLPREFADGVRASVTRCRLLSFAPLIFMALYTQKSGRPYPRMLCSFRRGETPDEVEIRAVSNGAVRDLPPIPYSMAVSTDECKVLLAKKTSDFALIRAMNALPCHLSDFDLAVRTGLTIETRYPECMRDSRADGAIPLLHPAGLYDGQMHFPPKGRKKPYIVPRIPSLKQPNRTMLLVKRVPPRAQGRHLVVGVYFSGLLPKDAYISTANKLNIIEAKRGEMDFTFALGLSAVLSSSYYERYCALTFSALRVNAAALSSLPLPGKETIMAIGRRLSFARDRSLRVMDAVAAAELAPILGVRE